MAGDEIDKINAIEVQEVTLERVIHMFRDYPFLKDAACPFYLPENNDSSYNNGIFGIRFNDLIVPVINHGCEKDFVKLIADAAMLALQIADPAEYENRRRLIHFLNDPHKKFYMAVFGYPIPFEDQLRHLLKAGEITEANVIAFWEYLGEHEDELKAYLTDASSPSEGNDQ